MSQPLSISFDLPFEDAIKASLARGVILPEAFYGAIPNEIRRLSTTVSGLSSLGQIQAVIDSVREAIAMGDSFQEWQRSAANEDWSLSPARLETVFRTNVQTAYSQGHWRSFRESADIMPFLMYSAVNDNRTRPTHHEMSGYIAHIDDPIWRRWTPPCGYNCRCQQIQLTEKQALDRGYGKDGRSIPDPDPGFGSNAPGDMTDVLTQVVEQRAADSAFPALVQQLAARLTAPAAIAAPTAMEMLAFTQAAATGAESGALALGPVTDAAKIAAATDVVLVEYQVALDAHGIRRSLDENSASTPRPVTQYDFLRVPLITAEPDRVEAAPAGANGRQRLVFVKRIGDDVFTYTAEARPGDRYLATVSLTVERWAP